ncbi:MAG: choice-of-anchor D domain-containing protein [Verrucomicrobiales bacterium]|jgi:hypothetical protein|nr:choice-of-anchor D domain-containing protein [Verrucomicrobiales bacterium]
MKTYTLTRYFWVPLTLLALGSAAQAQTVTYLQSFDGFADGVTELGDGSILETTQEGAAGIDNEAMKLTDAAIGSTNTGWVIPGLGEPAIAGWTATFYLALSGGGASPADGFSFNWGAFEGGTAGEEGYGSGLAIEFDTWDNGGEGFETGIGIDVSVDGGDVEDGQNRIDPDAPKNDNEIYQFDGEFRRVEVSFVATNDSNGVVNVTYGDNVIFEDLPVSDITPEAEWNFGFGARTGGAKETVLIDDMSIIAPPPGVYRQSFDGFADGVTDLGDGTAISSNNDVAQVVGGALQLTVDGTTGTQGAFRIPGLGGLAVDSWSTRFSLALLGGASPADGFAFNWGEIPEDGFAAEEGFGTGLAVEFDTWDNAGEGAASGIGIDISIDGGDVENGQMRIEAGAPKNDNRFFKFDGEFRDVEIIWNKTGEDTGEVSLTINGDKIYENLPVTGFSPTDAYTFAFGARTGGATETVLIDNLEITAPATESTVRDPLIGGDRTINLAAEFGKTSVGQVLIQNDGQSKDLVVSSATLGGDSPGNFQVTTEFPLTIAPGASAMVEVDFTAPASLGQVAATLTLENNDSLERARTRVVNLVGSPFKSSGSYVEDFDSFANGTTDLDDGSIIFSNNDVAKVVDGALQITEDGTGSSSANFKLPPLGPGGNQAFIVTFDLKLESEGVPADGFSFNYGNIPDNATAGEAGFGSGLAVEFDTYDNGGEGEDSGIGYDISINGVYVPDGIMRIAADDDKLDNRFYKFDGEFRPVEITWFKSGEDSGLLTVTVDGEVFYDSLPTPGFAPEPNYRFAIGARTGGANETVAIDNLNVITGTEDPNLFVKANVNSGVVQPDGGVQTLQIPVRNTGADTDLMISSVTLNPEDSAVYALGAVPDSIAPGTQGIIEVTLDPSKANGLSTAELVVLSNDPSQPSISIALSVSVPLSGDLVAWYKMDDSDGNLIDSSGNDRNGSFIGDITQGEGGLAGGSSVRLSPQGNTAAYASVPDFPGLQTMSFSMWVQASGEFPTGIGTLFSKLAGEESDPSYSLALFQSFENSLIWITAEDAENIDVLVPNQGLSEATHVVLVHEDDNGEEAGATRTRIYLNGVEEIAVEDNPGFADLAGALQIGARVGDNGFPGLIDDVQVYSRAISAEEVADLFADPGSALVEDVVIVDPPTKAPEITEISVSAAGVALQLPAGTTFDIEYSTDLKEWTVIANDVTGDHLDTDHIGESEGYYRGVVK